MNKKNSKKKEDDVKAELLKSFKKTNEECNVTINEIDEQMGRSEDVKKIIKQYEEVIMTQKENHETAVQTRLYFQKI